jgi:hypothetical protein
MKYPHWIKVLQTLDRERNEHPVRTVTDQLASLKESLSLDSNASIAVTVGSRGIANLLPITRAVVDFLKSAGCRPFLVPSMGSHGGATSAGQKKVLKDFGFTENSMKVAITSSMEVVNLGKVDGIPIYFDKHAYEADGVVVINRVKFHQYFKGEIQSGLNKMMALGLGKKKGADAIHRSCRTDILGSIGDFIRSRVNIVFGVAILENAYEETKKVTVLKPDGFIEIDKLWVKESRAMMPRIPLKKLDLLIVDELGKDISGSGMDTNVIGFTRRIDKSGKVAVPLVVFDLSVKSDGNAIGIGLADFTTKKLLKKVDFKKTYINVIATGVYSAGRIPMVLGTQREILDTILNQVEKPKDARIIRIKNTLRLDTFFATTALAAELENNEKLTITKETFETSFTKGDDLKFRN